MQLAAHRYFVVHKPYGMESQFKKNVPGLLLGALSFSFPEGIHAIGRLDKPSEGLLLLTTNKKITRLLFQNPVPHRRTYLVQVRGKVSAEKLHELRSGVTIKLKGSSGQSYSTPPCEAEEVSTTLFPPPRPLSPFAQTSWLKITITEGKFRQVRKMVAAINHRCLRLLRISIEDLELGSLPAGAVHEIAEADFFRLLKLGAPTG